MSLRRALQRAIVVQEQHQSSTWLASCSGAPALRHADSGSSSSAAQCHTCACSSSPSSSPADQAQQHHSQGRWLPSTLAGAAPRLLRVISPSQAGPCTSAGLQSRWPSSSPMRGFASEAGAKKQESEEPKEQQEPKEQEQQAGQEQEAAAAPSVEQLTADLQKKAEEATQLVGQVEKLTDQLKRSLAEMENVRMRAARDVDSAKKFAVQGFVKNILDVADNLERAAASVPADALGEGSQADVAQLRKLLKGLLEGVSATEKILLHVLKQNGVEQYNPVDQKFDPNLHNALFEMPVTEGSGKEVGMVAAVTKRGYKMHERVIRPADVGVFRA